VGLILGPIFIARRAIDSTTRYTLRDAVAGWVRTWRHRRQREESV